jgi:HK97 family phage portal protein
VLGERLRHWLTTPAPAPGRHPPSSVSAEARDVFSSKDTSPQVSEAWRAYGYSAIPVTRDTAIGLPAVGRAVTLIAETIASLPLLVYQGMGAEKRLRDDTWQYRLFNELPGAGDFSPFDFISDIAACIETCGNAFVQKVKAAGEVIALLVIDPQRVEVGRVNGEKRFRMFDMEGRVQTLTASTILHIRGFTVDGSDLGLSPITLHRQRLGFIGAQEQYLGRFYGQGVGKRIGIEVPGPLQPDEAKRIVDSVVASKAGIENSHLPLITTNNARIVDVGLSLEDAQYVESEKINLVQAAHIHRIPPKFLTGEGDLSEWDFIALHQVSVAPRLRRIVKALHTDPDLFPDRKLYPEFDVRELARTDAKTKAEVEHMQIQDGTLLKDEARADRGQPPLPPIPEDPTQQPGMVPLLTPTGAGANPEPDNAEPS